MLNNILRYKNAFACFKINQYKIKPAITAYFTSCFANDLKIHLALFCIYGFNARTH